MSAVVYRSQVCIERVKARSGGPPVSTAVPAWVEAARSHSPQRRWRAGPR